MPPRIDLSEQRFGRLVAKKWTRKNNLSAWECVCDCGSGAVVPTYRLRGGNTRSCGCLLANSKWGGRGVRWERAFYIWWTMLRRCNDPRTRGYKNYGARGIRVCDRWAKSYENFLADMGHPGPGMSIERLDIDKGYEPANCKWIPLSEQGRNRSNVRRVLHEGRHKTIMELADASGISRNVLYRRLAASGWVVNERTFRPVAHPRKSRGGIVLCFGGREMTIPQWAHRLGVHPETIRHRLKKGYPLDRVLRPLAQAVAVRLDRRGRQSSVIDGPGVGRSLVPGE